MRENLWTQQFITLSLLNFLVYIVFYLLMVVVASYAMDELHAMPSQAGLAAGIFILSALLGRLFTGRYIEQIGRKKTMYGGIILFSIVLPLYFMLDSLQSFYLVRFLHGFGLGCSTAAIATIIVLIIPKSRLGEGLSYHALSATIAMALGPLFGMFLYRNYGFRANLWVSVALSAVTLLLLLIMKIDGGPALNAKQLIYGKGLAGFFAWEVLPISLISLVLYVAYSSLTSFLTSYVNFLGLASIGSFYFMAYSIAVFCSRPFVGKLYDKYGNKTLYPFFIIFSLAMLLLGTAYSSAALLCSAICSGLGFGNFTSLSKAVSVRDLPPGRIGLANSTLLAISEIGTGVGPTCLGLLLPITGYRNLYTSMSLCGLIGMAGFYLWYGHKQKTN